MKPFFRNNGLSITLIGIFLLLWLGQSLAGHAVDNEDRKEHDKPQQSYVQYLSSGHFWQATFENWESEFLQMAGYIILTTFLYQKGSAESKDPDKHEETDDEPEAHKDDPDVPGPVKTGGWQLMIYRNSLSIALLGLFFFSFAGHALGGAIQYNAEQIEHGQKAISTWEFVKSSEFWFESMQNWQSEFLAVFAIVVLSIRLRQHGSPESKPVHAPHSETGER